MKPSEAVEKRRNEIRQIDERKGAKNPRAFGSEFHGNDTDESDFGSAQKYGRNRLSRSARINLPLDDLLQNTLRRFGVVRELHRELSPP